MKLQSDPTIIYGITRGYPLGRGILESEIEAATPYNTYAVAGLPPGPISNPGKDSLLAVLPALASVKCPIVAVVGVPSVAVMVSGLPAVSGASATVAGSPLIATPSSSPLGLIVAWE